MRGFRRMQFSYWGLRCSVQPAETKGTIWYVMNTCLISQQMEGWCLTSSRTRSHELYYWWPEGTKHPTEIRTDWTNIGSAQRIHWSAGDETVSSSSAFYVSIIPASPDRVLKDSWYSPRETQQRNVVSCQAVLFLLIPVRLISRPPALVLPPAKYRYNTSSTQTTSGENVRAKPDPANQDY